MAKKIKLELTEAQFNAIIHLRDDAEGMLGNGEDGPDRIWVHQIRLIDRMLKNNGYQRKKLF